MVADLQNIVNVNVNPSHWLYNKENNDQKISTNRDASATQNIIS